MNKFAIIEQRLDELDEKIVEIVGRFVKRNKAHYEAMAKKLLADLKKEAKRYARLLADEKIDAQDFELLVRGRWAQLKIELLAEAVLSKRRWSNIAAEVLSITLEKVADEG